MATTFAKSIVFFSLLAIVFVTAAHAQSGTTPHADMVIDNYDYMISLFPDDFPDYKKAVAACSTIVPEAKALKIFWDQQGTAVLEAMSKYAGIQWTDSEFSIYIVKYYPDYAAFDPLTIPLEGKKDGARIEALPQGLSHYVTLFQQLAKRLLNETRLPGATTYNIANHPLMDRTSRRFDNLANLLALRTLSDFADIKAALEVFKSAQWKEREPGEDIFFDNFWGKWNLSADTTLASRIAAEPGNSRLVILTRPPEYRPKGSSIITQGPLTGSRIGIKLSKDRSGYFRILDIDTSKAAYVSGLRKGDLIRSVGGISARTAKELFSQMLDNLQAGVEIRIIRGGEPDVVILYPRD